MEGTKKSPFLHAAPDSSLYVGLRCSNLFLPGVGGSEEGGKRKVSRSKKVSTPVNAPLVLPARLERASGLHRTLCSPAPRARAFKSQSFTHTGAKKNDLLWMLNTAHPPRLPRSAAAPRRSPSVSEPCDTSYSSRLIQQGIDTLACAPDSSAYSFLFLFFPGHKR